jgi:hypothetical protein
MPVGRFIKTAALTTAVAAALSVPCDTTATWRKYCVPRDIPATAVIGDCYVFLQGSQLAR